MIIVLGCPTNDDGSPSSCQEARADIAVALKNAGFSDAFITSGAAVHNAYVEADGLAELLIARGIDPRHVARDTQAMHTDENIANATALMQAAHQTTALVVSEDPGHLIYTGLCDSNCCVKKGRLSVFDFSLPMGTVKVGHYVLEPRQSDEAKKDCAYVEDPNALLCLNFTRRLACTP